MFTESSCPIIMWNWPVIWSDDVRWPPVISNTGNTTHQGGTMVNDEEPSLAFALALVPPSVIASNHPDLHAFCDWRRGYTSNACCGSGPSFPSVTPSGAARAYLDALDEEQSLFSTSDDNAGDSPLRFPSPSPVSESLTLLRLSLTKLGTFSILFLSNLSYISKNK